MRSTPAKRNPPRERATAAIAPLIVWLLTVESCLAVPDFAGLRQQTGVTAVAWTMIERDRVISTGGDGFYSLHDRRRVDEHSLLRVGSVTKTFTALAIMRLVEAGKLQLDSPIGQYLRAVDVYNPWSDDPVTIAMLLEHSAGLRDLSRLEFDYPYPLHLDEALGLAPERRQVKWRPGWHTSYTNAGAGLLSKAIETVSGRDYDDWLAGQVLEWLGMPASSLIWSEQLQAELISGYDSDLKTTIPYWHTLFRAFGALNTTAHDMRRPLQLLVNQGCLDGRRLLKASTIARMQTPTVSLKAGAGVHDGYGLGLKRAQFRGQTLFSHNGDADGYLARIAYSVDSGRGYFVMINSFRRDLLEQIVSPLDSWLIETLADAPAPRKDKMSRQDFDDMEGEYVEITRRFGGDSEVDDGRSADRRLYLENQDGLLVRRFAGEAERISLLPVAPGLFRHADESKSSVAWIRADDGEFYLQGGFGNYQKKTSAATDSWEVGLATAAQFSIDRAGRWYYQGSEVRREAMVRLFASQLRVENGCHLLVTPEQKLRVDVEDVPFIIVAMRDEGSDRQRRISLTTNVGQSVELGHQHALEMRRSGEREEHPYIDLGDGLWARVARNVFYELAEIAIAEHSGEGQRLGVWSHGVFYRLSVD